MPLLFTASSINNATYQVICYRSNRKYSMTHLSTAQSWRWRSWRRWRTRCCSWDRRGQQLCGCTHQHWSPVSSSSPPPENQTSAVMHLETDSLVLPARKKEKQTKKVRQRDPNFCIYYTVHIKHTLFIPINQEYTIFIIWWTNKSCYIYFLKSLKWKLSSWSKNKLSKQYLSGKQHVRIQEIKAKEEEEES